MSRFKRKLKIGELRISQCFDFLFLQLLTQILVCVRNPYSRCVTEDKKWSWKVILLADVLFDLVITYSSRSQWPRDLRRRSATAHLLRSWIRISPGAWMFVCCECFVLSGRGLCDELITRPAESYRLWCVVVCDLETSRTRRPWPALGRSATRNKKKIVGRNNFWR
jgi:hypothetical protein